MPTHPVLEIKQDIRMLLNRLSRTVPQRLASSVLRPPRRVPEQAQQILRRMRAPTKAMRHLYLAPVPMATHRHALRS